MILTIIGINFIIIGFFLLISLPAPVYPFTSTLKPIRIFAGIMLLIGALLFIIGVIIRIVAHFTKGKVSNRELLREVIDNIINYLKQNEGKAYTINALLKRVYIESQFEIDEGILEAFMHDLVIRNVIKSQLKNGEEYFMYKNVS